MELFKLEFDGILPFGVAIFGVKDDGLMSTVGYTVTKLVNGGAGGWVLELVDGDGVLFDKITKKFHPFL